MDDIAYVGHGSSLESTICIDFCKFKILNNVKRYFFGMFFFLFVSYQKYFLHVKNICNSENYVSDCKKTCRVNKIVHKNEQILHAMLNQVFLVKY